MDRHQAFHQFGTFCSHSCTCSRCKHFTGCVLYYRWVSYFMVESFLISFFSEQGHQVYFFLSTLFFIMCLGLTNVRYFWYFHAKVTLFFFNRCSISHRTIFNNINCIKKMRVFIKSRKRRTNCFDGGFQNTSLNRSKKIKIILNTRN